MWFKWVRIQAKLEIVHGRAVYMVLAFSKMRDTKVHWLWILPQIQRTAEAGQHMAGELLY